MATNAAICPTQAGVVRLSDISQISIYLIVLISLSVPLGLFLPEKNQ